MLHDSGVVSVVVMVVWHLVGCCTRLLQGGGRGRGGPALGGLPHLPVTRWVAALTWLLARCHLRAVVVVGACWCSLLLLGGSNGG